MNLTEMIKQKTLRLIGLLLIAVPLIASYTILRLLDLSSSIASIVTVCLSGVAYILLLIYIEPSLLRILPFMRPKAQNIFEAVRLKQGNPDRHVIGGPDLYTRTTPEHLRLRIMELEINKLVLRQRLATRSLYLFQALDFRTRGNWIHSDKGNADDKNYQ